MNKCIEKFSRTLEARMLPEATITKYLRIARSFMKMMAEQKISVSQSGYAKEDVNYYLSQLRRKDYKDLWYRFIILKLFFKANRWVWNFEAYEQPKTLQRYQPMFEKDEQEKMLEVAKNRSLRDHCIIRLAIKAGMRRVELWKLNREDFRASKLFVGTAKGGEPVWRDLDSETCQLLAVYLKTRRDRNPAMWVRGRGKARLSLRQLSDIKKQIREKAGISKARAGFHADRRRLVTFLDEMGLSPKEITIYFGWKNDNTVFRYIHPKTESVHRKVQEIVEEV